MKILYDREKLRRMLEDLHTLTGLKTTVLDGEGRDTQLFGAHQEFCRLINADPEGHRRCEACDARAAEACAAARGMYRYRCHAELCEVALPLYENGVPIAYLVFGQFLDDSPMERQWERTEQTLRWYGGDKKALREAFWALRQCSFRETAAYGAILRDLAVSILHEGVIRSAEYTDMQRLEMYLNDHFQENLPLKKIAADLGMGTTKLCELARRLPGGHTLTRALALRRTEAAKTMLLGSDMPISAVAAAVGYSDYNYFAKVFRSVTGSTPSAWRKAHRQ